MQKSINFENNEEMFNSAFINDLQNTKESLDLDLSNYYLDATLDRSLDRSIMRCNPVANPFIKFSPMSLKTELSSQSLIDNDFSLADSCLLFTTDDQIDVDLDQLTDVSQIEESSEEFIETNQCTDSGVEKSENESVRISCKNVVNYFMRPIASKFIKKLNKKFSKPIDKPEEKQVKIPIQLYSSNKNQITKSVNVVRENPVDRQMSKKKIKLNSNSILAKNLNDNNNFVNCGDLVTYFV